MTETLEEAIETIGRGSNPWRYSVEIVAGLLDGPGYHVVAKSDCQIEIPLFRDVVFAAIKSCDDRISRMRIGINAVRILWNAGLYQANYKLVGDIERMCGAQYERPRSPTTKFTQ